MGGDLGDWARTTVCVALTVASGCTRSIEPPERVASGYEGPIRSRDVDEGGRIFTTLCTACHEGRVNPRGYHWSPGQMRHQIREGNHLMPPLSRDRLSDEQVEAVLAYLSVTGALQGELPPPIAPPAVGEGPAENGETGAALDAPFLPW